MEVAILTSVINAPWFAGISEELVSMEALLWMKPHKMALLPISEELVSMEAPSVSGAHLVHRIYFRRTS